MIYSADMAKELLTLQECADELGAALTTVRRHVFVTKKLPSLMRGHARFVTRHDLEAFRRNRPQPGQPLTGRKDTARERQDKALALKEKGLSLSAIAAKLGYTTDSGVSRAVAAARKRAGND